jgi:serine/threonine protein kinase
MHVKADSEAARSRSGDDALRGLCFSDAVFGQRYDGWRVLGRGPWATVVRTQSRDLGDEIALKVFVNLDPELLERVRHEVRAVQSLSTPYVVHTYSLFDRGAIAWFEMELVEGPNLQRELDRLAAAGERLPLLRAYEIALAVSRCVWHAHRHGVLHRDVKPANVLLPASGKPPAKLGDFGIARLAELAGSTPPGTITGTPTFASPEALAGACVGPPHDVYALSATLFTLFTGGVPPYEVPRGGSIASLRRLKRDERPTPLHGLAPGLDGGVQRLLMQAMAVDPADRPVAGDVVLALERACRRSVVTAAGHGPKKAPRLAPLRFAATGLLVAVLGVCARLRRPARAEARRTNAPQPRRRP